MIQLEDARHVFTLHEPCLRLVAAMTRYIDFSSDVVTGLKEQLAEYDGVRLSGGLKQSLAKPAGNATK